jgi:branched-subunit amino acid transport protein
MFSSKSKSYGSKNANTLAVVVAVLFIVVTLPVTWKLVGNTLSMVGLPTEVKEVTDSEGNTCQNIPMLLNLVHAVVLALLTVIVLNWWTSRK